MYLDEIYLENTGPIAKCHVNMPFANDGNPLPVVIVGPNGSGKSIFLSYIVDAQFEFAKVAFEDIVPPHGHVSPYYRVILRTAIRSGAKFSLSLLRFQSDKRALHYCEKSGTLNPKEERLSNLHSKFQPVWKWNLEDNFKHVSVDEKIVADEMRKGAHVFFPASRREDPEWLNPKSLKVGLDPTPAGLFKEYLEKPIRVESCAEQTSSWLLDVFLDSMVDSGDLAPNANRETKIDRLNRQVLRQARLNAERILKVILQDDSAALRLNLRNIQPSRLAIRLSDGQVIPSLKSLSEGQSQLFNLFCTIIRYGERLDLNRSIRLADITGIVLIDEIDAHLHPSLQYEVVPQLIKLFPKVQFIMSSHSPLFLLGMEKEFGADKLTIIELPTGKGISSERYSEFRNAFRYYQETESFQKQIEKRIKERTKPLVLTEGKSDVHYVKTALTLLDKAQLLNSFDLDSVGGKDRLDHFKKVYAENPSAFYRPIILLYDNDANKSDEEINNLWVRTIPQNSENENTIVNNGIENLFSESLLNEFGECLYTKRQKDNGNIMLEFNKIGLCNWICDERKNPEDFEKFDSVVQLLEEFSAAHQSNDTGK